MKLKPIIFIFLLVFHFIFYGCVTGQRGGNKPILSKEELQSTKSIKIGYFKTPWVNKGINIAPLISPKWGLLLSPVGIATIDLIHYNIQSGKVKNLFNKYSYDTYGKLIMDLFSDKISTEISDWPAMVKEEQPLTKSREPTGWNIEIDPIFVRFDISVCQALCIKTLLKIKDPENEVRWSIFFNYNSREYFDNSRTIKDYQADDGRLFKEELIYSAQKTSDYFVDMIKERWAIGFLSQ